jgi:hypothetical protein
MIKRAKLEEAARSNDAKIRGPALLELENIRNRNALNKAGASTFETAIDVISKFTDFLWRAGAGLAWFVKVATQGKVDFTDSFRDISTLQGATEAIADEVEKQVDLAKERTELEERKVKQEDEIAKIKEARKLPLYDENSFKRQEEAHKKAIRDINKDITHNELMRRENIKNLQAAGASVTKIKKDNENQDKPENKVLLKSDTLQSLQPNLKEGALNPNAPINPKIRDAMTGLADDLNKLGYKLGKITSVNTGEHNEGSDHYTGNAFDFTVTDKEGNSVTRNDSPKIKELIEKYGLKFRDELVKPTDQKVHSGAHYHASTVDSAPTVETSKPAETAPSVAPLVNQPVSIDNQNKIMETIKDSNKKMQEKSSKQLPDKNISWNDLTDGLEVIANKMDMLNDSMQRMSVAVA